MEKLLAKTERLAKLIDADVQKRFPAARIEEVLLNTWEGRFEVMARIGETEIPFRVDENLVDDLFDSGSRDAEASFLRVVELALSSGVH